MNKTIKKLGLAGILASSLFFGSMGCDNKPVTMQSSSEQEHSASDSLKDIYKMEKNKHQFINLGLIRFYNGKAYLCIPSDRQVIADSPEQLHFESILIKKEDDEQYAVFIPPKYNLFENNICDIGSDLYKKDEYTFIPVNIRGNVEFLKHVDELKEGEEGWTAPHLLKINREGTLGYVNKNLSLDLGPHGTVITPIRNVGKGRFEADLNISAIETLEEKSLGEHLGKGEIMSEKLREETRLNSLREKLIISPKLGYGKLRDAYYGNGVSYVSVPLALTENDK